MELWESVLDDVVIDWIVRAPEVALEGLGCDNQ